MIAIEGRPGFGLEASLAGAWRRLQADAPGPAFLHDPEHLESWLRHFGRDATPMLLVARDGGEVVGIAPLMSRTARRRGLVPYRSVRFLGDAHADYAPLLVEPDRAGEAVAAMFEWLFEGGWRWEALVLDNLLSTGPAASAARAWLRERDVPFSEKEGRYYYVDLARPYEEVMAETGRRFVRKNLNLARNRLARAGGYAVEAATGWDAARVLAEAAPLHGARQRDLGRGSLLADPDGRAFVSEVIAHHTARGRFRAYWMRHAGRTVAYMLGFEEKGVYHAWNMAFDPAAARFYPSRVLIDEILRDCHARGVREFDFMRGEADYKSEWTQRFRPRARIAVRNRTTVYGRTLHFLEAVFARPREATVR